MSTMEREMDVFSDLAKLRSEADEKRSALEEMREELGARRVAVAQNLNEAQDRHDKAKVRERFMTMSQLKYIFWCNFFMEFSQALCQGNSQVIKFEPIIGTAYRFLNWVGFLLDRLEHTYSFMQFVEWL